MQATRISFLMILAIMAGTVTAQDASLPQRGKWLRQLTSIRTDFKQVWVVVRPEQVGELTFNGQRLIRRTSAEPYLKFDVTSLARKGRNCIAIGSVQERLNRFGVGLFVDGRRINNTSCRMTQKAPPVGWRQSDFNDRDWTKAQTTVVDQLNDAVFAEWKPTQPRSKDKALFQADDHVVMLGATFVERSQRYGHLETQLCLATSQTALTFRNLGWSGDTVFAESRGIFDSPQRGYERMIEHVRSEEPSVILICYGQNEAMQSTGTEDVGRFQQQLKKLCADLSPTGAEIVLVSPHPVFGPSSRWSVNIAEYVKAVQAVAEQSGFRYVDLHTDFLKDVSVQFQKSIGVSESDVQAAADPEVLKMLSDNGMHWNELGYRFVAHVVAERFVPDSAKEAVVRIADRKASCEQLKVGGFQSTDGAISFELIGKMQNRSVNIVTSGSLYGAQVNVHGQNVPADRSVPWVNLKAADELRQLIVRKNELYFHRWRPQNITYLFGFRKHEQGNNAAEIALFDPRIAEVEEQIRAIRQSYQVQVSIRP